MVALMKEWEEGNEEESASGVVRSPRLCRESQMLLLWRLCPFVLRLRLFWKQVRELGCEEGKLMGGDLFQCATQETGSAVIVSCLYFDTFGGLHGITWRHFCAQWSPISETALRCPKIARFRPPVRLMRTVLRWRCVKSIGGLMLTGGKTAVLGEGTCPE